MELCTQSLRERISLQTLPIQKLFNHLIDVDDFNEDSLRLSAQLGSLVEETGNILSQILSGLVFIHSQGVAHKDLKPENGSPSLGH